MRANSLSLRCLRFPISTETNTKSQTCFVAVVKTFAKSLKCNYVDVRAAKSRYCINLLMLFVFIKLFLSPGCRGPWKISSSKDAGHQFLISHCVIISSLDSMSCSWTWNTKAKRPRAQTGIIRATKDEFIFSSVSPYNGGFVRHSHWGDDERGGTRCPWLSAALFLLLLSLTFSFLCMKGSDIYCQKCHTVVNRASFWSLLRALSFGFAYTLCNAWRLSNCSGANLEKLRETRTTHGGFRSDLIGHTDIF